MSKDNDLYRETNFSGDARAALAKIRANAMTSLQRRNAIKTIVAAKDYRSGENDIGSVYMGGHTTASLCYHLGYTYRDILDMPIREMCTKATDEQLKKALEYCKPYIDYMKKNPVKKCPHCGQIMPVRKRKSN